MRNFEDRMAEIYRRSGERIRARQRRRKMAALCIPLVLSLSAGAVVIATQEAPSPGVVLTTTETATDANTPVTDMTITVSINGTLRNYHDPATVERAGKLLDAIISGENTVHKTDAAEHTSAGQPYRADAGPVFKIVIYKDGEAVGSYQLSGDELLDVSAQESYVLTTKQINDLRKVLDLQ